MRIFLLLCILLISACKSIPEDRGSAFARTAGESTLIIGGCNKPLTKGFEACQLERGKPLPLLRLAFMNPAEYAISDCELNRWITGSVSEPKFLEFSLQPINHQIQKNGFCILKVETIERYPDNGDPNQLHEIPISGGFFIELLESGYNPSPSRDVIAWCYRAGRTTKGRTVVKQLDPEDCGE